MSRDLYFYFRDIKEDLTEEDKKTIDTLFNNLLLERQEGIMGYIAGKYHWSDRKGRKAIYDIQILKKQFQNIVEMTEFCKNYRHNSMVVV